LNNVINADDLEESPISPKSPTYTGNERAISVSKNASPPGSVVGSETASGLPADYYAKYTTKKVINTTAVGVNGAAVPTMTNGAPVFEKKIEVVAYNGYGLTPEEQHYYDQRQKEEMMQGGQIQPFYTRQQYTDDDFPPPPNPNSVLQRYTEASQMYDEPQQYNEQLYNQYQQQQQVHYEQQQQQQQLYEQQQQQLEEEQQQQQQLSRKRQQEPFSVASSSSSTDHLSTAVDNLYKIVSTSIRMDRDLRLQFGLRFCATSWLRAFLGQTGLHWAVTARFSSSFCQWSSMCF
jgi:hypothetical protein